MGKVWEFQNFPKKVSEKYNFYKLQAVYGQKHYFHNSHGLRRSFINSSVRVAERLALPTSDHGVAGSNPAGGEILPEPKWRFIAQSLSYSPFHHLEMTKILLKGRKTLTHPSIFCKLIRQSINICTQFLNCGWMRMAIMAVQKVWKTVEGQGKVSEKSGNFEMEMSGNPL